MERSHCQTSFKGELLGQRSMISDEPVNLSAVALEDMEVCLFKNRSHGVL
jgi:CRP-like cAMP-binding protein